MSKEQFSLMHVTIETRAINMKEWDVRERERERGWHRHASGNCCRRQSRRLSVAQAIDAGRHCVCVCVCVRVRVWNEAERQGESEEMYFRQKQQQ